MGPDNIGGAPAVRDLKSSAYSEFTLDPNFHLVAAFFSGFVFWSSLFNLLRSPFARHLGQRIAGRLSSFWMSHRVGAGTNPQSDSEAQNLFEKDVAHQGHSSDAGLTQSIFRRRDNPTLIFALTLLFFMSSLAQFISSLVFNPSLQHFARDQTACAFLTAWESMSFQSARLVGLIVLGLSMSSLGVKRREIIVFWTITGVIAVLIIVENSLEFGHLQPWVMDHTSDTKFMALCYRRQIPALSVVLSLIAIGAEVYCILRLLNIIAPPSFPLQRKVNALTQDMRIVRGISLLVLDLIILVPNAIHTNYLGQSLPFSVASLIVLATFNNFNPSLVLYHQDQRTSNMPKSNQRSEQPVQAIRYVPLIVSPHPFSAAALSAAATKSKSSNQSTVSASAYSNNSGSDARLLQVAPPNAAVSLAYRNKPVPRIPAVAQDATSADRQRVQKKKKSQGSPSRRSSRSRTSSHKTPSSKRSQKLPLVRPIIPKAELARQFNYNEQSPAESTESKVLAPRPQPYTHNRSMSAPITDLPRAVIRAGSSGRHSQASMAHTVGSSIRYGSDILRPEPGRTVRDKMRASVATKVQTPVTAYTQASNYSIPDIPSMSMYDQTTPYQNHERDSWRSNSNTTINAYTFTRDTDAEPPTPTYIGAWPMPPPYTTSMTVSDLRGRGEPLSHSRDVRPRPPKMAAVPALPDSSVSNTPRREGETDQPERRMSRPPRTVKGPRMQFPPPRSRTRPNS